MASWRRRFGSGVSDASLAASSSVALGLFDLALGVGDRLTLGFLDLLPGGIRLLLGHLDLALGRRRVPSWLARPAGAAPLQDPSWPARTASA